MASRYLIKICFVLGSILSTLAMVDGTPCARGYYCPLDTANEPHCACDMVGAPLTKPCGSLTRVTGNWGGCESNPASGCSIASSTAAGNLVWLGGSTSECTHESCRWKDIEISVTLSFPSIGLGDRNVQHLAAVFFRGQQAFQGANGVDGVFERMSYKGMMLSISPETSSVELFEFFGNGKFKQILAENTQPTLLQITPAITANVAVTLVITVEGDNLSIQVNGGSTTSFANILLGTSTEGSVGLFSTRQQVTFTKVSISNMESTCAVPCPAGTFNENVDQTSSSACIDCSNAVAYPGEYLSCEQAGSEYGAEFCPRGSYCPGDPVTKPIPCPAGTKGVATNEPVSEADACVPCTPGESGCHVPGTPDYFVGPSLPGFYVVGDYSFSPQVDTCLCLPAVPYSCGEREVSFPSANGWSNLFPSSSTVENEYGFIPGFLFQMSSESRNQAVWFGSASAPGESKCNSRTCEWNNINLSMNITIPLATPSAIKKLTVFFRLQRSPDIPAGYGLEINPALDSLSLRTFPWEGPSVEGASTSYDWHYDVSTKLEIQIVGNQFTVLVEGNQVLQWTDASNMFPKGSIGWSTTAGLQAGIDDAIVVMDQNTNEFLPCATPLNSEQVCGLGTFQEEYGKGKCEVCLPGFYGCDVYGSGYRTDFTATVCEPGYYCPGGAALRSECPIGTYSESQAVECSPCPAGTIATAPRTSKCSSCPAQFVDINNSTECRACSPDVYAIQELSTCESATNTRVYKFESEDLDCARLIDFGGDDPSIMELECSSISLASDAGELYLGITAGSAIINFIVLLLWLCFWRNPIAKASQRELSVGIIVSALCTSSSLMISLLTPTHASCGAQVVLPVFTVTILVGCLLAKIRRAHQVFNIQMQKLRLRNSGVRDMVLAVAVVVAVQICIIIVWTIIDAPIVVADDGASEALQRFCDDPSCLPPTQLTCGSNGQGTMQFVAYGWVFIVLLYCCVLAWQTRNLTSLFAEAKLVAFTIYTVAVVAVFLVFVLTFAVLAPQTSQLLFAFGICFFSTVVLLGLFGPKLYLMMTKNRAELVEMVNDVIVHIGATSKATKFGSKDSKYGRTEEFKFESRTYQSDYNDTTKVSTSELVSSNSAAGLSMSGSDASHSMNSGSAVDLHHGSKKTKGHKKKKKMRKGKTMLQELSDDDDIMDKL